MQQMKLVIKFKKNWETATRLAPKVSPLLSERTIIQRWRWDGSIRIESKYKMGHN